MVYTATPMAMSAMVTDEGRATYFGYLTGTQQIGIGVGPVVARILVETPLGFRGTFLAAGVLCLVAVMLTMAVGILTPATREVSDGRSRAQRSGGDSEAAPPFGAAVRKILGSEAAFSLVMILLFACLFTSMTSFQTTFARAQDLDYSVYYLAYTAAVIFSRFVVSGMTSRFDTRLVIAAAVSVMALAVASFLLVGSNALIYGSASALLGLGYGLALPSVQAQAVNVTEEALRPRVLPIAGLIFQAAILGFPLLAGWIIAGFGYGVLFALLVSFALLQATIGWWRFAASSKRGQATKVSST